MRRIVVRMTDSEYAEIVAHLREDEPPEYTVSREHVTEWSRRVLLDWVRTSVWGQSDD